MKNRNGMDRSGSGRFVDGAGPEVAGLRTVQVQFFRYTKQCNIQKRFFNTFFVPTFQYDDVYSNIKEGVNREEN